MKFKLVILIIFALPLLTSCWFSDKESGTDATVTSPTIITPPSATITPESIPQASQPTQIVAVTELPPPTPSITPTPELPTATPLPAVPWLLNEDENVQIQIPDPSLLLHGVDLLLDNPAVDRSRINLAQLSVELVVEDLKRHYPTSVPNAAGLDLSYRLLGEAPELARPILQTRVVQYLNALSVDLVSEPFHSSWAYQVEAHRMSNAGEPIKLLLEVRDQQKAPYSYIDLLVPVKVAAGGKYLLVENDLPIYDGAQLYSPTTVIYSQLNFSETTSTEFLVHQYGHSGGSHNYYNFYLFDWGEEGVYSLDDINFYFDILKHEQVYPQHTIDDFNGDDKVDIKIMRDVRGFFGCRYPLETVFSWSAEGFTFFHSDIPDTAECNAHQWFYSHLSPLNAEEARAFLIRAIEQWSLEPPPSDDLLTFLQLQLVFAQGSLGEQQLAEQSFAELLERPPSLAFGNLFAEYAAVHDSLNVLELCNLTNEHIPDADYSEINPYIYAPAQIAGLGTLGCLHLIEGLIHSLEIPAASEPENVIQSAGIDTTFFYQVDLEDDGSLEWAGFVEAGRSTLFIIWQGNEKLWQPIFIDGVPDTFAPTGGLEVMVRDFNNDGLPDIGYLHSIVGQECETAFRLVIHAWPAARNKWAIYDEIGCGVRSLADFDFAESDFVLPNWYTLSGFEESDQTLPELLDDLTHRVAAQNEQVLNAAVIDDLLDYLPMDSNEVQLIVEFLYYLRGLNYELMGDEEMAVDSYLMLLELNRSSPWSWMAAARLSS